MKIEIKEMKEEILEELNKIENKEMPLTKFWKEVEKKRKINTIASAVEKNYTVLRRKCFNEKAYSECNKICR